ncbi:class I SAM-dependent methyltransferase, partial [bacterium]|nr:class I SAM-dependent methyltransferase [bacterium]
VVYDILAAPGTEGELDVLESVVGEWAAPVSGPRLWLEPACGTGRCLRGWAARGQRAIGFDVSGTMVADARRRLRRRGASGPSVSTTAPRWWPTPAAACAAAASWATPRRRWPTWPTAATCCRRTRSTSPTCPTIPSATCPTTARRCRTWTAWRAC